MSEPRKTIEELLSEARGRLRRLEPAEASAARSEGALLIDIRSEAQRAREGVVPGALFFPRNVLEWRCDPSSPSHDPRIGLERRLIVMCNEGYQSSLAAATLQELGFEQATDLAGGFQAWRAAGLPVRRQPDGAGPRSARCSCGVEVEGEDDADLLLGLRDHFAAEHPAESPTDEQLRERIAASA
jgi:rhodanese-related sulfurtransferase